MNLFERELHKLILLEGGYVLHTVPGDTGGQTYAGISRVHWPDWKGWRYIDNGDFKAARKCVGHFYRVNFWNAVGCEDVPNAVRGALFNFAVNAGVRPAIKVLQRAVGAKSDGWFGPLTEAAIAEVDPEVLRLRFKLERVYFYGSICEKDKRKYQDKIKSNYKFLPGWINRIKRED